MTMSMRPLNEETWTGSEEQWIVLWDHEHILYSGSLEQCEDWLDLVEYFQRTPEPETTDLAWPLRGLWSWTRDCIHRSLQRLGVRRRVRDLLHDEVGSLEVAESALLLLAVLFAVTATAVGTAAVTAKASSRVLTMRSSAPHHYIPADDSRVNRLHSADIACDAVPD